MTAFEHCTPPELAGGVSRTKLLKDLQRILLDSKYDTFSCVEFLCRLFRSVSKALVEVLDQVHRRIRDHGGFVEILRGPVIETLGRSPSRCKRRIALG